MTPEIAERRSAFDGVAPFPATNRVKLVPTGPLSRILFRGGPGAAAAASAGFGPMLSPLPMRAHQTEGRAALWLGPDEWLLVGRDGDIAAMLDAVSAAVAAAGEAASVVDVSHRNTGLLLTGTRAVETIAAGCPLDLDVAAFPIGMCSRTLLGKVEIVLWRQAADRFHIECWRSFAPHVHAFLAEAAREYVAG